MYEFTIHEGGTARRTRANDSLQVVPWWSIGRYVFSSNGVCHEYFERFCRCETVRNCEYVNAIIHDALGVSVFLKDGTRFYKCTNRTLRIAEIYNARCEITREFRHRVLHKFDGIQIVAFSWSVIYADGDVASFHLSVGISTDLSVEDRIHLSSEGRVYLYVEPYTSLAYVLSRSNDSETFRSSRWKVDLLYSNDRPFVDYSFRIDDRVSIRTRRV